MSNPYLAAYILQNFISLSWLVHPEGILIVNGLFERNRSIAGCRAIDYYSTPCAMCRSASSYNVGRTLKTGEYLPTYLPHGQTQNK